MDCDRLVVLTCPWLVKGDFDSIDTSMNMSFLNVCERSGLNKFQEFLIFALWRGTASHVHLLSEIQMEVPFMSRDNLLSECKSACPLDESNQKEALESNRLIEVVGSDHSSYNIS
eukprot:TRINITY_DN677_c0_g2_i1.p1 TRINITY_DN677_c0_g2~~TRINITY_DN677_c0_g2_i1.p1  ORF type:complete len:115 (-),score=12.51 TRINITY_DN677_c0_g2_i1:185-529(-)